VASVVFREPDLTSSAVVQCAYCSSRVDCKGSYGFPLVTWSDLGETRTPGTPGYLDLGICRIVPSRPRASTPGVPCKLEPSYAKAPGGVVESHWKDDPGRLCKKTWLSANDRDS
jgi:hypothetical protein